MLDREWVDYVSKILSALETCEALIMCIATDRETGDVSDHDLLQKVWDKLMIKLYRVVRDGSSKVKIEE